MPSGRPSAGVIDEDRELHQPEHRHQLLRDERVRGEGVEVGPLASDVLARLRHLGRLFARVDELLAEVDEPRTPARPDGVAGLP